MILLSARAANATYSRPLPACRSPRSCRPRVWRFGHQKIACAPSIDLDASLACPSQTVALDGQSDLGCPPFTAIRAIRDHSPTCFGLFLISKNTKRISSPCTVRIDYSWEKSFAKISGRARTRIWSPNTYDCGLSRCCSIIVKVGSGRRFFQTPDWSGGLRNFLRQLVDWFELGCTPSRASSFA